MLQISLGIDAIITLQLEIVCSHIKSDSVDYDLQFKQDSLFGLKFANKVDSKLQIFFTKCMDKDSIRDVSPSVYDFATILRSVENDEFMSSLLSVLSSTKSAESLKVKVKSKDTNKSDSRMVKNNDQRRE